MTDRLPETSADLAVPRPAASFAIATFNRKECLVYFINSVLAQTVPVEITICDDGSSDGTAEEMARLFPAGQFPNIRYHVFPPGNGPCVLRNVAAALSSGDVLFPIDDDSLLSTPDLAEKVLREFSDPRIAAVAIPRIDVRKSQAEHERAPDEQKIWITSEYVGASCAIRREAFMAMGGYVEDSYYMGEEWEIALRLLDTGRVVKLGTSPPIHHYESPSRSSYRAQIYGCQNSFYLPALFVPAQALFVHLTGTIINRLRFGLTYGNIGVEVSGLWRGLKLAVKNRRNRVPVGSVAYRLNRRLRKQKAVPLADLEGELPPLRPLAQMPVFTEIATARAALAARRLAWREP